MVDETKCDMLLELATSFIGGGYGDYDKMTDIVKLADHLNIKIDYDEIEINLNEEKPADFNNILYEIMKQIINYIGYKIEGWEGDILADYLRDDFMPYINYLDSHFNIEPLDEADLNDNPNEIINNVIEYLKEKYEGDKNV